MSHCIWKQVLMKAPSAPAGSRSLRDTPAVERPKTTCCAPFHVSIAGLFLFHGRAVGSEPLLEALLCNRQLGFKHTPLLPKSWRWKTSEKSSFQDLESRLNFISKSFKR